MKMKSLIMSFFCIMIIISNINSHKSHNHKHKLSHKKQHYRPNVHDIKRFLKPQIAPEESAYRPEEVDSLSNLHKASDGNFKKNKIKYF